MLKPIYASAEHEVIVSEYMNLMISFVQETSSNNKYQNFLEVVNEIIDYHNRYGEDMFAENWNDWLLVLPINLSVCCNGYFAALETKRNAESLRTYKVLLDRYLEELVESLSKLKFKND
tara:strand:+ start:185 stop:541 length:357 start_codon:yes stop_codon:yes gene_type:complete